MRGRVAADIVGQTFGRLTVVARARTERRKATWLCRCSCGVEKVVKGVYLRDGTVRSCGCLRSEETSARQTTHGATRPGQRWPEWGIWRAMINRCHRPQTKGFENYGGRGIYVCDRWRHGEGALTGFEAFIADIGRRPSADLTLDREDNDGPYAPGNVRWVTRETQANNRRPRRRRTP